MKYMGSKRYMLENGLGELICEQARDAHRIVDLFCGAGAVSWFAGENTARKVIAVDLQNYAVTLAGAVIERNVSLDYDQLIIKWLSDFERARARSDLWSAGVSVEKNAKETRELVKKARILCEERLAVGPVWNAYGGHYFSPTQALTFDCMLKCLPHEEPERTVCLAATLISASKCAASPGHTAQPFQPTETAAQFLREAWKRDPLLLCKKALWEICPRHAKIAGEALVSDAIEFAKNLHSDDLVIVDPPYSGVQYSRFYHVLETMALGYCNSVEGVGRYPPIEERPQSAFSNKSQSKSVLTELLSTLARVGATVIFTFPAGECTNGLSGNIVTETACVWYDVEKKLVNGRFSTLGGNNTYRASRNSSSELLLLMRPKK